MAKKAAKKVAKEDKPEKRVENYILPKVATNFYYACKKCDKETFHVVLAHSAEDSAKLECEICGSKKTYKLPSLSTRGRSKKASLRSSAESAWNMFNEKLGMDGKTAYKMTSTYEPETCIDHVKFGVGFIKSVTSGKIEVIFIDAIRLLVHNRT